MQSHPTNNTKLYRSSQLLHQHSERSRQQHDFSSMTNAWQRIPSHPLPSPPPALPELQDPAGVGGGAPALPLHCQSITEIVEASVVAEKKRDHPGLGGPLGQGGKGEPLTTAGPQQSGDSPWHPVPQARRSHQHQWSLALPAAVRAGWAPSSPHGKSAKPYNFLKVVVVSFFFFFLFSKGLKK